MRGWFLLLISAGSVLLASTVVLEPAQAQQGPPPVGELFGSPEATLEVAVPDILEQALDAGFDQASITTQGATQESIGQASYDSCEKGCANRYWGDRPRTYAQVEYLLWSLPGVDTPVLLTSNPLGTPDAAISDPNDASTQTLIGGSEMGDWAHSGVRLRFGKVVNDGRLSRWELSGWSLFERSDNDFFESTGGDPILARPFINATTDVAAGTVAGEPNSQVLSLAGEADGSFRSEYDRSLFGIEPLAFFCMSGNGCASLEAFTGYRYLHYEDELRMTETATLAASGLVAPGSGFLVEDTFSATNDYHMLPLGLHYVRRNGGWRVSARGSVSIGFVSQEVRIQGRTTRSVGSTITSVDNTAGVLALASNIGTYDRTEFAFVPELNLQLHRALGKGVWANVGYTLLYLNDVVRAPAHIDTTIDPAQFSPAIGTGTSPGFAWNSGGELLHGLNAGLELHYLKFVNSYFSFVNCERMEL
jgi:hypothetical protein